MAKSLGQIHTVNQSRTITTAGQKIEIDLPGQLTQQLQRMIRAGQYFKIVGIDLKVDSPGVAAGGQLSGVIRYYAPTKGRCDAFRGAFKAMADVMKAQGISMRDNELYDFRAPLNDGVSSVAFPNQATLDGVTGLALNHVAVPGASIFEVHNRSQQPQYTGTAGDLFQPGFDTLLQNSASGTDFILNDEVPYTGDANFASTEYETIPWQATWTPGSTDLVTNFQWRPDPALFLAVMCGQMEVIVEDADFDPAGTSLNLEVAVMTSGWKSIMSKPKSRRRTSKKKMNKPVNAQFITNLLKKTGM